MNWLTQEEADALDAQFWADLADHEPSTPADVDPDLGAGYRGKDMDLGHEHRLHGMVVPCHNGSLGKDSGLFGGYTIR